MTRSILTRATHLSTPSVGRGRLLRCRAGHPHPHAADPGARTRGRPAGRGRTARTVCCLETAAAQRHTQYRYVEAITSQVLDGPAHGSVIGTDHQITYTPESDFTGNDSFTYLVNDGTADSNLAAVTILVRDVDLAIGTIDVTNTTLDEQTLTLSGSVSVEIRNSGAETVNGPYQLLISALDLQHSETSMKLGQSDIAPPLAAGDAIIVDAPVAGAILFKDAPIYAFVDSADGHQREQRSEQHQPQSGRLSDVPCCTRQFHPGAGMGMDRQ